MSPRWRFFSTRGFFKAKEPNMSFFLIRSNGKWMKFPYINMDSTRREIVKDDSQVSMRWQFHLLKCRFACEFGSHESIVTFRLTALIWPKSKEQTSVKKKLAAWILCHCVNVKVYFVDVCYVLINLFPFLFSLSQLVINTTASHIEEKQCRVCEKSKSLIASSSEQLTPERKKERGSNGRWDREKEQHRLQAWALEKAT